LFSNNIETVISKEFNYSLPTEGIDDTTKKNIQLTKIKHTSL